MGQQRTIRFPGGQTPSWDAIRGQLLRVEPEVAIRMIDGMPAFPDEVPEPGWNELRVGLPAGMVTVRRQGADLVCVVWGDAGGALARAWDWVSWACAAAGTGEVHGPGGPASAEDFAAAAGISPR
jgi:hypothetical protein